VRALALAERLPCSGTAERIEALVAAERLPAELGTAMLDSLHFFMRLKLDAGLRAGGQGAGIELSHLSSLDRDLLKDTLAVVKRFKLLLERRFRLDAM
jgi:CBS domain-containing protein